MPKAKLNKSGIWQALKKCRQENGYKARHQRHKKIYRQIFPLPKRYWIRDKIVSWRILRSIFQRGLPIGINNESIILVVNKRCE